MNSFLSQRNTEFPSRTIHGCNYPPRCVISNVSIFHAYTPVLTIIKSKEGREALCQGITATPEPAAQKIAHLSAVLTGKKVTSGVVAYDDGEAGAVT